MKQLLMNLRFKVDLERISGFEFHSSFSQNAREVREWLLQEGVQSLLEFLQEELVENGKWFQLVGMQSLDSEQTRKLGGTHGVRKHKTLEISKEDELFLKELALKSNAKDAFNSVVEDLMKEGEQK